MTKEEKKRNGFAPRLGHAVIANLIAGVPTLIVYLAEQPRSRAIAVGSAVLVWAAMWGFILLGVKWVKPLKKHLKCMPYYFPLTAPFWGFSERHRRFEVEEKLRRLEKVVNAWPDVSIIARIVDPEKQQQSLNEIINKMDNMEDNRLSQIVKNIRHYAQDIVPSVDDNGNYDLFRQLIGELSLYEPTTHPETYTHLLWLLSDIFEMPPKGNFTRQVQKDMIGPLENAIWRADQAHLNRIGTIIEQIMSDEEDEHDLARDILEMLLTLDWMEKRTVWQIIFDESKKRAFRFPRHFGDNFLRILSGLEHRVFGLDVQSLRDILEESLKDDEKGLLRLRHQAYKALRSKVFSPLEDPEHKGTVSGRVFRRLTGDNGKVKIECTFPDGKTCSCDGESLSFRGLYSKECLREVGEKLKVRAIPIKEVEQPRPKHEFALAASVAPLHPVEAGKQSEGRGLFFEDADEDTVKGLYEYISSHPG